MLLFFFPDKKKNWAPVDIQLPSIKPESSNKRSSNRDRDGARTNKQQAERPNSSTPKQPPNKTADSSQNWRADAKGTNYSLFKVVSQFFNVAVGVND